MTQGVREFDWVTILRVVDADTIACKVDVGFYMTITETFRLARINAPERGADGFAEANEFVRNWIVGRDLKLAVTKKDKWHRYLAEVMDKNTGENLNDVLLSTGHARTYE